MDSLSADMILQHLGEEEHILGAVSPPIFQTSTFVHDSVEDMRSKMDACNPDVVGYGYSRIANPTCKIVEKKIAALEKCESARIFGSGMAAITAAILSVVKTGSHVVCVDLAYGPTRNFFTEYLPKFGISTSFVTGIDPQELFDAVQDNTHLIYLETPSSILFQIQDLKVIADFARSRGIVTAIDSTYSAGILMQPHTFGIDLICHTASKFFGGHSDIIGGAVAGTKERMDKIQMNEIQFFGHIMHPFTAWLMLRGMRTLDIRLAKHERNGNDVCAWLESQSWIENVFHVGSASHPQRALIDSQMSGSVGLLSFVPKMQDESKIMRFMDSLKVYQLGVSWGGFESLAVMLQMKPLVWEEPKWVVRLYCGLESSDDLLSDLQQAAQHLS